jgi:hypothetical protein
VYVPIHNLSPEILENPVRVSLKPDKSASY